MAKRPSKMPVRLDAKPTKPHSTKKGARGYDRKATAPLVREEIDALSEDTIAGADLDESERLALRHFARLFDEARTHDRQVLNLRLLRRSADGHILVTAAIPGSDPDLGLAMLMERKAEQVYKQTGCRFQLVQRPSGDPSCRAIVWRDGAWRILR